VAFAQFPPKVRSLVIEAYMDVHTPGKDASQSFKKSRKVKVG
jgi:hypothetical protein